MAKSPSITGLFFGSFDPVHLGHLVIAEYIYTNSAIENIWFVISPQNPLKSQLEQTDCYKRKEMLELAIKDNPHFAICDIEFQMPAPHYTYQTLQLLKTKYPQKDFVLIIGSDNLENFDKWKDHQKILEMMDIYVYPRIGFQSYKHGKSKKVHIVEAPLMEISSTYIRNSFSRNQPIKYMLHKEVYEYITQSKLYSGTGK